MFTDFWTLDPIYQCVLPCPPNVKSISIFSPTLVTLATSRNAFHFHFLCHQPQVGYFDSMTISDETLKFYFPFFFFSPFSCLMDVDH